jgi:ankyrin repeat protein
MEERYMREVLSPAHLSQCITIHGTKFTEKIFQNSLLCMDSGLDLLILFSLVYAGDETMAIDLVQMRATQGCNDFLPQQYSNKALVMAARRNYLDLARTLLELGIDPFTEDSEFCPKNPWRMDIYEFVDQSRACSTGFQTACRMGRREMVKLFLAWEGSSSHPLSKQHRSLQTSAACIHAVCSGKLWLEEMLRVMGIDFHNSSQVLGSTYLRSHLRIGLQFAMNYEKVDLAKRLMDLGSDPCAAAFEDDRTFSGPWHTPLQCAARQENLDFVRKLLSMGAIPKEEPANSSGATAIQFAAIRGNFEILELLIQAGRDINAPKSAYRGRTALQGAAEHGRLDMTRHLLGLGVDVRGRDNTNYVGAVRLALYEGHRVLAQMIQDWKREQYGEEDCEDFETIKASSDLEDWDGDYLSDEEDWISGDEDEG